VVSFRVYVFCILILQSALTPEPEGGARCVSSARRDLCGGCWVTGISTVTIAKTSTGRATFWAFVTISHSALDGFFWPLPFTEDYNNTL